MKKKKHAPRRKSLQLILIVSILSIVAIGILYRVQQHAKQCQHIEHTYQMIRYADTTGWAFSNTERYFAFVDMPIVSVGEINIYDRKTCLEQPISGYFSSFHGWSHDDSYLALNSRIGGSSGCNTFYVYSGNGHRNIFEKFGCYQQLQATYVFVAWLDDAHVALHNNFCPMENCELILNLENLQLIENLSHEDVEQFANDLAP